ncbi:SHOCT domain-containing protein [Lactococcus lactis]|uniref:SHOCT domain-containing protein n=1 Tax=Lactococcus lactis TaxID=1358 RepID=UPI0024A99850|nr:SHOCT domain-containing protein [Lactococcus lactis]
MKNYIEELKELKELLDNGILTQEEFDSRKTSLLESVNKPLKNKVDSQNKLKEQKLNPLVIDKKHCAACNSKIGRVSRFELKDGNYICFQCLKKIADPMTKGIKEHLKKEVTISDIPTETNKDIPQVPPLKKEALKTTSKIKLDKNAIICPKCKSANIQFLQQGKKAFSVGKAVGGAVLTGGIGTIAGFAGKKGKKQWRCNDCGNMFETKK